MQPQLVALDLSFPISSLRLNIRVRFQVRDYPGLNLDTESESSAESVGKPNQNIHFPL